MGLILRNIHRTRNIAYKDYIKKIVLLLIVLIVFFVIFELTFRVIGIGEYEEGDYTFIKHSDYNPFLIFGPNVDKEIIQKNGEKTIQVGIKINRKVDGNIIRGQK